MVVTSDVDLCAGKGEQETAQEESAQDEGHESSNEVNKTFIGTIYM